jgi:hypothetical protein
VWIERSSW